MNNSSPSLWLSKRFFVAFVLFLCFVNFQILRNNVNITVVEMTSNNTIIRGNVTIIRPPDFNWDSITIGFVLSILAYGGLLSFLGGFLVDWLGGSVNCSLCLLVAGLTTIVHPAALYVDFRLFLACRFVTGMFESFFYVSIADIFARWFPKNERSTLISFSFNGTNVGVAVVYPICGYLADTWGWQTVFYVTGTISVISSIFCVILVRNRPSQDKWISKQELKYILEETESTSFTEVNHPYRSILTSGPVWSICIVVFAYMWISTVVGSCLPLYIKDMTQKSTDEIGLLSSIPNIVFIISFPIAGALMNYWNNHSSITITRIHKIMMIFACVSSTIALLIITLDTNFIVSLIAVVVIQIVTSFMTLIIEIVPVSLHSDSSSVIVSMISVFLSFGAIVSQSVTSLIVVNHTVQEWNNCFLLASSILLVSGVIFGMYGSSEAQPWTTPSICVDNRRPSIFSVHFTNDASKLPARSMGLLVRKVSINNTEIQTRVRKLSPKNTEIHDRVRKLSTRSLDLRKSERKLSLGQPSFTRNDRRPSAVFVEILREKVGRRKSNEYSEDVPQQDEDEHQVTSSNSSENIIDQHISSNKISRSESDSTLQNSPPKEESTCRSSLKNMDIFSCEFTRKPSMIQFVKFIKDQQALSVDDNPEYTKAVERRSFIHTLQCLEDQFTPKSSVKSIQASDDECGPTSGKTECPEEDSGSPIKNLKNSNDGRRSSLKNTELFRDERRPSIKSVQFLND